MNKHFKGIVAVLFAALCIVLVVSTGAIQAQSESSTPPLDVKVSVVLDTSGTTLAFSVKNNQKETIGIQPAGVASNFIVIRKPGGGEIRDAINVFWKDGPPKIQAGQSMVWKHNAFDLFTHHRLYENGTYRIHWIAEDLNSRQKYESNELLIIREEGTPAIDPITGLPVQVK